MQPRTRSTLTSILALGAFAWCALDARPASAESSCASDTDCAKGWACQVTGGSSCGYACAPGADCPPPPDCAPQEYKSCVPGPCTADSDCSDGMVCYTQTTSDCPPSACASNDPNCAPADCSTRSVSSCVPRYAVPCTKAADCGAGFTCEKDSAECACSGSAPSNGSGAGSSDGGTPLPPTPSGDAGTGCTCAPSTTAHCSVVEAECASNSDCSAGWTCETVSGGTNCATTSAPDEPARPEDAGASNGDDAGKPVPDPCTPSPSKKLCAPPYYATVGAGHGVDLGGVTSTPSKDGSQSGGSESGAAPPAASDPDPASSAGCSIGAGPSRAGSAGALLFALGLFGVVRRRRAARAAR